MNDIFNFVQLKMTCNLNLIGELNLFEKLFEIINLHEKDISVNECSSGNKILILNDESAASSSCKSIEKCYLVKQMNIITKYYETKVNLNIFSSIIDLNLIDNTDGIIIYLVANDEQTDYNTLFNCDIKNKFNDSHLKLLLVENLCKFDEIFKNKLVEFSHNNDIYIIELNLEKIFDQNSKKFLKINKTASLIEANDSSDNDSDNNHDHFEGFNDLLNTLYVHQWSIMNKIEAKRNDNSESKAENIDNKKSEINEQDENKDDDLEDIIMNLHNMRAKALDMNEKERKLYAEDIVKKFWNAIGGDKDELDDLDDFQDSD